MKILFYLGHPAHYHFFKFIIFELKQRDHEISIFIKSKDILEKLLRETDLKYINILPEGRKDRRVAIFIAVLKRDWRLLKAVSKDRVDLMVGSEPALAHVGSLLRIPSIIFGEDDIGVIPLFAWLTFPFAIRAGIKHKENDESMTHVIFEHIKIRLKNKISWILLILLVLFIMRHVSLVTLGLGFVLLVLVSPLVDERWQVYKRQKDEDTEPYTNSTLGDALVAYMDKLSYNAAPSIKITKEESVLLAYARTSANNKELEIIFSKHFIKRNNLNNILAVLAGEVSRAYRKHGNKLQALRLFVVLIYYVLLCIVMANPEWVHHLGFKEPSLHASLLLASLLIIPLTIFGTMV